MVSRSVIPWPPRTRGGWQGAGAVGFAVGAAGLAALVAYALVGGHRLVATSLALFPLVAWVLGQPLALLVALGVVLPDARSLTGGRGGFNVSISDLVLLLVGAAIVAEAAVTRRLPAVRALRPVAAPVSRPSLLQNCHNALHTCNGLTWPPFQHDDRHAGGSSPHLPQSAPRRGPAAQCARRCSCGHWRHGDGGGLVRHFARRGRALCQAGRADHADRHRHQRRLRAPPYRADRPRAAPHLGGTAAR